MTQPKPDCTRCRIVMRTVLPLACLLISHVFVAAQPAGFVYGKLITIQSSKVSGTQTDFPVLINLTDPDLRTNANGGNMRSASANDVVFTSADGTTLLPYQLEKYTSSAVTAQLVAWVKVPAISSGSNVTIAMFYSKTGVATSPSTSAIWDANYLGIWHFNNTANDGSSNGRNLTNPGTATTNFTSSIIGDGRQMNTSASVASNAAACRYLKLPNSTLAGVTNFSFEGWALVDDNTTSWERIFDFGQGTTVNMFLTSSMATNGVKRFAITNSGTAGEQQVSSSSTTANGSWHHFAVTIDAASNTSTLYYDGAADASNTGVILRPSDMATDNANYFGRSQYNGDNGFYGKFDEFRLSNAVRSPGWIQTTYNNQSSPATFYSISARLTAAAVMSSLPVTLRSFTGTATTEGTVQLVWQTETETNNKTFVVERSAGDDHWEVLATVGTAGNGQDAHQYTTADKTPFYPVTSYRLRQVDIDGKATYLSTIAVRLSATGSGHLVLYPNPAHDHALISLSRPILPGTVKVRLTDYLGRVHTVPFSTAASGILLQTGGLSGGTYALTVYANGLQYAEKLVIAR